MHSNVVDGMLMRGMVFLLLLDVRIAFLAHSVDHAQQLMLRRRRHPCTAPVITRAVQSSHTCCTGPGKRRADSDDP